MLDDSITEGLLDAIHEERDIALLVDIKSVERKEKFESVSGEFGSYIESNIYRVLKGNCINYLHASY